MIEEIKALKELLDSGAITEEEYEAKKREILSQPVQTPSSSYAAPAPMPPAPATGAPASEKSKVVAGVLALLLGGLGVHKFYLGYTTQGIIMLLITILGSFIVIGPLITGVISLIEGITYLFKSDDDFQRIYVTGNKGWF